MRKQRGSAFVVTLAILTGLVMLVVTYAASQFSATREITSEVESRHAKRIAEAAVQRALAELANADEDTVLQTDEWYLLGEASGENFLVDSGSFRIQILDEGSFVNLNSAGQDQLLNLGLTNEQADSLMDWREASLDPRAEGAKDEYYNTLEVPYNAALRSLRTLDELLLIRGFSSSTLFELPTEESSTVPLVSGSQDARPVLANLSTVFSRAPWTNPQGGARLNVNTATVAQLQQIGLSQPLANAIIQRRNTNGTFSTLGSVLETNGVNLQSAANILNNLSVNASTEVVGRLNLNTASEAALNSLPGMSPDITQGILALQQTGFTAIGDITSVPGVTVQWLQQTADSFVVGSRVFRIRTISAFRSAFYSQEAVVQIDNGTPKIVALIEQPHANMRDQWQWVETTTGDIILAEDQ